MSNSFGVSPTPPTEEGYRIQFMTARRLNNPIYYGCGICEEEDSHKEGSPVEGWFSDCSRSAHSRCVKQIKTAEAPLRAALDTLFPPPTNRGSHEYHESNEGFHNAHINAIRVVRSGCGNKTIKEFLDENGEEALKRLFLAAAKELQ